MKMIILRILMLDIGNNLLTEIQYSSNIVSKNKKVLYGKL